MSTLWHSCQRLVIDTEAMHDLLYADIRIISVSSKAVERWEKWAFKDFKKADIEPPF